MNQWSDAIPAESAPSTAMWRGPALGAGILALIFLATYWEFLHRQVRWAINQQADWGHTLIIPFIAGYFVYRDRARILARPLRTNWFGLVVVTAGIAMYALCSIMPPLRHHNLQATGVWTTLVGLVLLFCGLRATLLMAFPLIYLFIFGQSVSERFMKLVTYPLQNMTAVGSEHVLRLLTFDLDRIGNTLILFVDGEERPLNVAEACSGMRMLMAFLALGLAMAYTGLPTLWQRSLLVLGAVPTALIVNILRVVTLAVLSSVDANFAAGDFHSFVGLVWLVPAFFLFLGFMWIIRHLVTEAEPAEEPSGGVDV